MVEERKDIGRWTTALLLVAAVICFYWKLILTNQFTWLAHPDAASQILPWFEFQAGEIHKGRFPLWDPNQWGGQPLLAQAQPGAAYPPNWVLYALPLGHGWLKQRWLHWYLVSAHLLAAWFGYLFARALGARRWASVPGGAAFSLGAWMGQNEWPQMLNGGVWAPLVFLNLLRVWRGERTVISAALGGFFLGVAWLSGHINVPIYIGLAALGWWGWMIVRKRRLAGPLAVFCAMAFCAAALQVLPGLEYGRLAVRWGGGPEPMGWDGRVVTDVHREYSTRPAEMLGILIPGMFWHSNPFAGVTLVALAVAGVACFWRKTEARLLLAVGLGSLLYALGPGEMLQGVISSVLPMVEKARSPSMAVMLVGLSMAMLAALGMEAALERAAPLMKLGKVVLWLGAGIAAIRLVQILVSEPGVRLEQLSMATALAAVLFGSLLLAWKHGALREGAFCICTLGLFVMEAANANTFLTPAVTENERMAQLRALSAHGDIAEFLRKWPGLPRVMVDSQAVPYNFGDWYGVHQTGGYLASVTENVYRHDIFNPSVKRLMGVEFLVADKPAEFHTEQVFRSASGLKVYRNAGVLPRAFAVHEAERITDRKLVAMHMDRLGAQGVGRKTLLLEEPPALERCAGPDRVWVKRYTPLEVVLGTDMACRGMVVLADVHYPGWKSEVDGRAAKIWEAYALVRGVVVEKGTHEVVFRYRSWSVVIGAVLSALAALMAVAMGIMRRYNRPGQGPRQP